MTYEYTQIFVTFIGLVISAMRFGIMIDELDRPIFPIFALIVFLILFGMEIVPRLS